MNLENDFIKSLNLNLTEEVLKKLQCYSELVLEKSEDINLTSSANFLEVWNRHICDGLKMASVLKGEGFSEDKIGADFGSGAGFIGLVCALVLPKNKIYLVESLQKRCKFLQWIIYKLDINADILNLKIGASELPLKLDFCIERAMGEIDTVYPLCISSLKEGSSFFAMLSSVTRSEAKPCTEYFYSLPDDDKINSRKISVYKKYGYK